jgi:exosortase/archaeosortase family protein
MNENNPEKPVVLGRRQDKLIPLISFLALALIALPFISAFNDFITGWVISLKAYRILSEVIVPTEIRWIVVILRLIGIEARATAEYIILPMEGTDFLVELIWNCIGWQSLVMFIISSMVILNREFGFISKLKAVILGLVGTVMVNILRIVFVIFLYKAVGGATATVFHDYGSLLVNTAWLLIFWWFCYRFVLEQRVIAQ